MPARLLTAMPYPLPEVEDYVAIRAALAIEAEPRIRARVLDKLVELDDQSYAQQKDRFHENVRALLSERVARGTWESWGKVRARVYERDRGICHVCGRYVEPDVYECGHIIDRMCGGTDRLSNLVTMHALCNRLKDPHSTREEYLAWWATDPIGSIVAEAMRT